ncbi:MAG: GNAT family N-acetyltransferase [Pleomorphochaeta sp.]|jgi:GNAT superfamily N-acetyltransferase
MIKLATIEDLIEIGKIYDEILTHEEENISYTNWQKGLYPTLEYAKKAIEEKTMFVGINSDGLMYGSVILNNIQPKEYNNIDWIEKFEANEIMVIHTLCIRPSQSGQGHAKKMVKFSEDFAKEKGYKVIHLDTYEGNFPAAALYPKMGYLYSGKTKFHFQEKIWETLICFEKTL